MAKNQYTTKTTDVQASDNPSAGDRPAASTCHSGIMGCGMGKKGLKGLLLMAACCGAPVLILLVLPAVGSALGGLGTSALRTVAFLACPLGMGLMMWLMMRGQQAGAAQPVQMQVASAPEVAHTLSSHSREVAGSQDLPATGDPVGASSSLAQEELSPPLGQLNGHQADRAVVTDHDQQPVVPVQGHNHTSVTPSPRE